MDFEDEGFQEPSGWLSSSDSDGEHDGTVIALTPYSRITEHQGDVPIAKKRLLPGRRPPHDPLRELAIHKLMKQHMLLDPPIMVNVIPLLTYEEFPNGRITLDFPLMQTDLRQVYLERKTDIAKDPIQTSLMMQRFSEILSALQWVHELGIIHRDVNPSNILLSEDLKEPAFLADFGIAWVDGHPDDPEQGINKYSAGVGTGYVLKQSLLM